MRSRQASALGVEIGKCPSKNRTAASGASVGRRSLRPVLRLISVHPPDRRADRIPRPNIGVAFWRSLTGCAPPDRGSRGLRGRRTRDRSCRHLLVYSVEAIGQTIEARRQCEQLIPAAKSRLTVGGPLLVPPGRGHALRQPPSGVRLIVRWRCAAIPLEENASCKSSAGNGGKGPAGDSGVF